MPCRRRHGITRSSTFKEEIIFHQPSLDTTSSSSSAPSSPLASRKNQDHGHQESPLSSGYNANSSFQDRSKERGASMDKRTQEIQETFKLQNKKIETNHEDFFTQNIRPDGKKTQSEKQKTVHEHQLMASRDVAIATAAKAKLLLREIKTIKADLAFAKERSSQLEKENKMLRDAREKGDHPAEDEMIRLQLESLLAEKARLAHENSVYVRENSCLREIIKYHKLTMQDVVYLDEGIEEVAEVNPQLSRTLSVPLPSSPQNRNFTDNPLLKDSVNLGDTMKGNSRWSFS